VNYLLDVSVLVALLTADHEHHAKVTTWAKGKKLAVCPLTELGFLRVALAAYHATPEQARRILQAFQASDRPQFVPADISALSGEPFPSFRKSTDWYIANLAQQHGLKWATLDQAADHPAAALI
jgi:predicted nucleic acid-binding protein